VSRPFFLSVLLGTLMVFSAVLTAHITPTHFLSSTRPAAKIDAIIPSTFDVWKEEKNLASAIISPQRDALLNKLYTETVSRTYVNEKGERIMLSIAYGIDQRDGNAVHYPEVCYPAQGFKINSNRPGIIETSQGAIFVRRLDTNLANQRYEPVTYWTTVGNKVIKGPIDKKVTEMSFGLQGQIPDGLIFRVSSIDTNKENAFIVQESFVKSLANTLSEKNRNRLMGLH
jgi:EpsI family protein